MKCLSYSPSDLFIIAFNDFVVTTQGFCHYRMYYIINFITARKWYSLVREPSLKLVSGVIFVCLLL